MLFLLHHDDCYLQTTLFIAKTERITSNPNAINSECKANLSAILRRDSYQHIENQMAYFCCAVRLSLKPETYTPLQFFNSHVNFFDRSEFTRLGRWWWNRITASCHKFMSIAFCTRWQIKFGQFEHFLQKGDLISQRNAKPAIVATTPQAPLGRGMS
jgi:hypothetical protein